MSENIQITLLINKKDSSKFVLCGNASKAIRKKVLNSGKWEVHPATIPANTDTHHAVTRVVKELNEAFQAGLANAVDAPTDAVRSPKAISSGKGSVQILDSLYRYTYRVDHESKVWVSGLDFSDPSNQHYGEEVCLCTISLNTLDQEWYIKETSFEGQHSADLDSLVEAAVIKTLRETISIS